MLRRMEKEEHVDTRHVDAEVVKTDYGQKVIEPLFATFVEENPIIMADISGILERVNSTLQQVAQKWLEVAEHENTKNDTAPLVIKGPLQTHPYQSAVPPEVATTPCPTDKKEKNPKNSNHV